MRHIHIFIGALGAATAATAAISLLIDPGGIDPSAAALTAVGLMIAAVSGLSGLLLARAPWGRWGLVGTTVTSMILVSTGTSVLVWVTYALGGVALIGLLGPWLRLWVRHSASTEAPGPIPIALTSVAAVAPLYIGLASIGGAGWLHWSLATLCVAASVLYGRGIQAGLWLLRVGVPILGFVTVLDSEPLGAAVLALGVAAVTILSWLPAALRTTTIVTPPLPAPVNRR